MTWQEWVKQYLIEERARKLKLVELLLEGRVGTSEMRDGGRVDTTARSIATEKEHIDELEKILAEAGVAFDA